MTFTLIIFIYAGVLSQGDSVALDHISGFKTMQECGVAGEQARTLTGGTFKSARYVCIVQNNN